MTDKQGDVAIDFARAEAALAKASRGAEGVGGVCYKLSELECGDPTPIDSQTCGQYNDIAEWTQGFGEGVTGHTELASRQGLSAHRVVSRIDEEAAKPIQELGGS